MDKSNTKRTSHKTYGVQQGWQKGKPRWFVVCDGKKTYLHFAHYEFALQKAELFCQSCHKPFVDFQGNKVIFTFEQITYEMAVV